MKRIDSCAWLACFSLLFSMLHLSAEQTAVVKEGRVNVRGQPSLIGEVVTQLQAGDQVIVLEEVAATRPKTNEPPRWARIQMPANTPVWVYAPYVDGAAKTVNVSRLNVRAGPGENYSVVGRLERGAPVQEIRRVEDWMEIETPPGAYAFVAADLLRATAAPAPTAQAPAAQVPAAQTPTAQTPTAQTPTAQTPAAQAPAAQAAPAPDPARTPSLSAREIAQTPPKPVPAPIQQQPQPVAPAEATPYQPIETAQAPDLSPPATYNIPELPPQEEEAPPVRIVRREGIVRSTMSIQAPTYFELLSPENRKTINYLHTSRVAVNLKEYRGRRIVVTGEEAIDPRWPKTPVIEVQTLELIP